jgi:hypothetical protein
MWFNLTLDSNGGSLFQSTTNGQLTGTGSPSGVRYIDNGGFGLGRNVENNTSGGTVTITEPLATELISQGSAPNFLLKSLLHMTINPDGVVTANIDTFTTECR